VTGNLNRLEDKHYIFHYPLIKYGLNNIACQTLIKSAGLPIPPKSSCFFSPHRKISEVLQLDPELIERGRMMEASVLFALIPLPRGKQSCAKQSGAWVLLASFFIKMLYL
jgi:hypothetical protein